MNSKKGVSPLIATVLLLAFAVSIATIIVQLEPFTGGCGISSAEVMETNGKQKICYREDTGGIQIHLENGNNDILKIKASITGKKDIKNLQLNKTIDSHTAGKIVLSYGIQKFGQPEKIIITPTYNKSNKLVECPLELEVNGVQPC